MNSPPLELDPPEPQVGIGRLWGAATRRSSSSVGEDFIKEREGEGEHTCSGKDISHAALFADEARVTDG